MANVHAGIPVPHKMTAAELIEELSKFPGDATIDELYMQPPDRPGIDSKYQAINLSYTT